MPEQFDPVHHRVFEVLVTERYRTYVVAGDAKEVELTLGDPSERAALMTDYERPWADASYEIAELAAPLQDDSVLVGDGPHEWGRRMLTVNRAMGLIREPRPAPAGISTTELHYVSDWDWLRLASTPMLDEDLVGLRAVFVANGRGAATDGRHIHEAPAPCPAGLWDAETGEAVQAVFPHYRHCLSDRPPSFEIVDLANAWRKLCAARPGKALLSLGGMLVNADYLAEALIGAVMPDGSLSRVLVTTGVTAEGPVQFTFPDTQRVAAVMPIRARLDVARRQHRRTEVGFAHGGDG